MSLLGVSDDESGDAPQREYAGDRDLEEEIIGAFSFFGKNKNKAAAAAAAKRLSGKPALPLLTAKVLETAALVLEDDPPRGKIVIEFNQARFASMLFETIKTAAVVFRSDCGGNKGNAFALDIVEANRERWKSIQMMFLQQWRELYSRLEALWTSREFNANSTTRDPTLKALVDGPIHAGGIVTQETMIKGKPIPDYWPKVLAVFEAAQAFPPHGTLRHDMAKVARHLVVAVAALWDGKAARAFFLFDIAYETWNQYIDLNI